jgi:chromosome segregation ATPase
MDPSADGIIEAADLGDLTSSTAFLSLDTLLDEGRVSEDRAQLLKEKYKELHERVLQIYSNDSFLLKRARALRKSLDTEKLRVEKCGEIAVADDTSIQQLKRELANAEHELSVAQEKESMLQVEALELDRKRQTLTHDVEESEAQEQAKLKPLLEAHHRDIEGIHAEITRTAADFEALKAERQALLDREEAIRTETAAAQEQLHLAKLEFGRIEREPERTGKQADIVARAVGNAEKELKALNDRHLTLEAAKHEILERTAALAERAAGLHENVEADKKQLAEDLEMVKNLGATLELDRESGAQYAERAAALERSLKESSTVLNAERERVQRVGRERERLLKEYKQLDQQMSDVKHECTMIEAQMEVLRREAHALERQRRQAERTLEELKRDVDVLIHSFLKEELMERRCSADHEEMVKLVRAMEDDVAQRSADEQAQRREVTALSLKREHTSRECSRAVARRAAAVGELKVREQVLVEVDKRLSELRNRLTESMEKYALFKRERSAKAQLIQSASQQMSETQEKIKILENELEVLRRESLLKEQELRKKEREAHESRQACKNLRVERNRWNVRLESAATRQRDLKQQMSKLNTVITGTEDDMLALKQGYEDAVENRNYTGIQLIDRNDELCILFEKASVQEKVLKQGTLQLHQRESEIRALAVELADLQREIDLCQRVLPQVRDMEEDLADALMQLEEEKWRAEVLEADLSDPNNPHRWRHLERMGKSRLQRHLAIAAKAAATTTASSSSVLATTADGSSSPTAAAAAAAAADPARRVASDDMIELSVKHQQLEKRLVEVGERLMEKDLILDEISELTDRLRQQAVAGKDFTLALAKQVNGYQFGIKAKTKKMMATLSELSMVQASTIKLEMDVQRAESEVLAAKERAAHGAAPTEDIRARYERDRADELRRTAMLHDRKDRIQREERAGAELRTTAERRPDVYVPDTELGLPLPFGAHAPFKPNLLVQANASRYCRPPRLVDVNFDS